MDSTLVSSGNAFAIEFTTCFALIFTAFGVGLDPRQREVFGPALGPIFVGLTLATCTFVSGFSREGFTGFCEFADDISPSRILISDYSKLVTLPDALEQWLAHSLLLITGYSGLHLFAPALPTDCCII